MGGLLSSGFSGVGLFVESSVCCETTLYPQALTQVQRGIHMVLHKCGRETSPMVTGAVAA